MWRIKTIPMSGQMSNTNNFKAIFFFEFWWTDDVFARLFDAFRILNDSVQILIKIAVNGIEVSQCYEFL